MPAGKLARVGASYSHRVLLAVMNLETHVIAVRWLAAPIPYKRSYGMPCWVLQITYLHKY